MWPGARRSGGEVVTQEFIDAMRAQGARVGVVAYRRSGEAAATHADDLLAGERPIETHAARMRAPLWMLRAVAARLPYSAAKYVSRGYRRRVGEALLREPDLVVVDHAQIAWVLDDLPPNLRVAYLAHNVEGQLYSEQATQGGWPGRWVYGREARRIARLEERAVSRAAEVWALSDADARALETMPGARRVRVFGVGQAADAPQRAGEPMDVVLLGRWTWAANAAGLHWFLEEVVPRLPAGLRVHVGGAGGQAGYLIPASVTFHGPVDDAAAFLARARVIVVPARAGAGVQIKTLDAIASGRPVVATSLALRGIPDPPPTVRVADDPAQFAREIEAALAGRVQPQTREAARTWMWQRRQRFGADVAAALADITGDVR